MIKKPTILLLVLWALFIGTAFVVRNWLSYRPKFSAQSWHAARQLSENQQLRPDDLEKPNAEMDLSALPPIDTLVGYHLVLAKNAGEVVEPKNLTPLPTLRPIGDDESYVVYPLTEGELPTADLLKPGNYVQPCVVLQQSARRPAATQIKDTLQCQGTWFEVAGVHRKNVPAPVDWIVLKVPRAEVSKTLALTTATPRRLVISSTKGAAPAPQPTPAQTKRHRGGQVRRR